MTVGPPTFQMKSRAKSTGENATNQEPKRPWCSVSPRKIFWSCVISFPLLNYFSQNGAISLAPAIAAAFLLAINTRHNVARGTKALAFSTTLIFCTIGAGYTLFGESSETNKLLLLSNFFVIFFTWISVQNLRAANAQFLNNTILIYLLIELIIVIGQFSTMTLGYGFRVSEEYPTMLTGTQANANNLATICIGALLSYTLLSARERAMKTIFVWTIVLALLILLASRSALVLAAVTALLVPKKQRVPLLAAGLLGVAFAAFTGFSLSESSSLDALSRIFDRLNSFVSMADQGILMDSSMNLRFESYLHYLRNIFNLGAGTGAFGDYMDFFREAPFDHTLMSRNPHSLIIEISYWMGYVGLGAFIAFVVFAFFEGTRNPSISTIAILIFIVAAQIPSSVMGTPLIFFFFLIAAEASKDRSLEGRPLALQRHRYSEQARTALESQPLQR